MRPPYSRRTKIPRNPGTLESGAVASTPAIVSQMRCTGVSTGAGWNVCVGKVGTSRVGVVGNVPLIIGVPVAPAWKACISARLGVAAFCAPCCYMSKRTKSHIEH